MVAVEIADGIAVGGEVAVEVVSGFDLEEVEEAAL